MNPAIYAPVRPTAPQPEPDLPVELPLSPGDRGPDVSGYQVYTDWTQVAGAGMKFAFVKATEGTTYANPFFTVDWAGIQAAGIGVRGTYHFSHPSAGVPEQEAAHFLMVAGGVLQPGDLLVNDIEEVGVGDVSDWCIRWADYVAQHTGVVPWLYSGGYYMAVHGLASADVAAHYGGLWLAAYQSNVPGVPAGWKQLDFWQFTSTQSIPGINTPCDCSIYRP